MSPPIIALLAAGQSVRFNGVKLAGIINQQGCPLLLDSYLKLKCVSDSTGARLVVVLGAHGDRLSALLPAHCEVIHNSLWREGLASSVKAAATYAREQGAEALLISLADQVALQPKHFFSLLKARSSSDTRVCGFYEGSLSVPAIFTQEDFPSLEALTGDRGAKSVLNNLYAQGKMIALEMENGAFDIDTQAELATWRAENEPVAIPTN